jgi:diaminopropionate ammonia-lyase
MAMLECYEPSLVAWRILARAADAFMTVDEDDAISAMRALAAPIGGDRAIVAGESGGVGFAALRKAVASPEIAAALGLDADSRILLINTEGATDPARYTELVGAPPEQVAARNNAVSTAD